MIKFKETSNPIFGGKKLDLDAIMPTTREHYPVYRPKDTWFGYCAWPSVCRDENGTLYALSAAFGSEHVCPFNKVAMYISKNNGKTWSPPIIVADTYLPDGHGGITYLGNGKLIINYAYMPGDIMFNENYTRINMGEPRSMAKARCAYVDTYKDIPPEKLIGASFIKISEDYGFTWSEPIRMPISNVHGLCQCKDGTLLYLGKEWFKDPSKTFEDGIFDEANRPQYNDWWDFVAKRGQRRMDEECDFTPMYIYESKDGGYTWKERAMLGDDNEIPWKYCHEPYLIELDDGTLLAAIRVESPDGDDNDYTVAISKSTDGGYTWTNKKVTHIPGAPPHILKHSSGKLICVVGCRRECDGFGEYGYISEDNGETWTEKYAILDKGPNYDLGYPCSVELDDGSIVTVYYHRYYDEKTDKFDDKPCIMCTRWTL